MDDKDLYSTLGIGRQASDDEISKAYKKLARTHHPDKGGSEDEFKKIQRAYDVLSDKKAKEFYDMTGSIPGEDGAPAGGMPFGGGGGMPFGFNMADLFGMFGGGGGGARRGGPQRRRPGKAPPRIEKLPLSLKQLYNGFSMQVGLNREKFCPTCKGAGSKTLKTCDKCNGSGTTTQHIMVGPGMVMQSSGPCLACEGHGEQKGDPCGGCEGKGLTRQTKTLDIHIVPGTMAGETITFEGEASDTLEFEEGSDLKFVIELSDDENGWVRDGNNLRNTLHISLTESLCGCHKELSGHPGFGLIHVEVPRGVQNGEEIIVAGRGMPRKGSGYGHLYLKVHVVVRDAEQRVLLEKADTLTSMFDYKHDIPTGNNVFSGMKAL